MTAHPARSVPYDELLANLETECKAGRVFCKREGPLALFGYTNACTYDRTWNKWNLIARGLVLDVEARRVVATPFPKFFNYGESRLEIPGVPHFTVEAMLADQRFTVSEKMDGSLGIGFYHGGAWRVVTRGAFSSEQAKWATEWLLKNINRDGLAKDVTYLFEIVYNANRIVTRYDFEGLVLLSAYFYDGMEAFGSNVKLIADAIGTRHAPVATFDSVASLLEAARALPSQHEGWVVRFASGLRIKIKGDEYCRIHRLISNVTPLAVWEAGANKDDLDALRADLPEEFLADFNAIARLIGKQAGDFLLAVEAAVEACEGLSDSETGAIVQAKRDSEPAYKWVFPARKHGFLDKFNQKGPDRVKAFNSFRPTGNVLEGYTPSTSINRFQQEAS